MSLLNEWPFSFFISLTATGLWRLTSCPNNNSTPQMNRFIIYHTRTTTNNVKHDRINWLINNNNEEEDVQENILPPSTYVLDSLSLSLAFILFVSRSFILHLNAHPYLHPLCCVLMSSLEHLPGTALCFIHMSGELDLNFEMRHNLHVFLFQIGQFKLKRFPECS